jgi:malate dehydrogenase
MVDSIVMDRKELTPCAVRLHGEYGIYGAVVGVPVRLGASGAEQIAEFGLTEEERAALEKSAQAVRETCAIMGLQ